MRTKLKRSVAIHNLIDDEVVAICKKNMCSYSAVVNTALNMYLAEHHPHSKFMAWMNEESETVLTNPERY